MTKPTRDRGASAVEFALILPLLVFFIFGIIEFGFYVYNQQVITNASREGVRAGIVARNPRLPWDGAAPSVEDVVLTYSRNRLVPVGLDPTVNVDTAGGGYNPTAPFGAELRVTVTYQYPFFVLPNIVNFFFSGTMPNSYTLTAVTVMRYE